MSKPQLDIEIAPLDSDELTEVADLAARVFADTYGAYMTPEQLQQSIGESRSVAYFSEASKASTILTAKLDGRIVGYVQYGTVKVTDAPGSPDDRELGRLYVDTDLQGRGIGRQLMDAALSDSEMVAAPNIYLQVWVQNPRAIKLYEDYGFERIGVTHFTRGHAIPDKDLIMIRRQR